MVSMLVFSSKNNHFGLTQVGWGRIVMSAVVSVFLGHSFWGFFCCCGASVLSGD